MFISASFWPSASDISTDLTFFLPLAGFKKIRLPFHISLEYVRHYTRWMVAGVLDLAQFSLDHENPKENRLTFWNLACFVVVYG